MTFCPCATAMGATANRVTIGQRALRNFMRCISIFAVGGYTVRVREGSTADNATDSGGITSSSCFAFPALCSAATRDWLQDRNRLRASLPSRPAYLLIIVIIYF